MGKEHHLKHGKYLIYTIIVLCSFSFVRLFDFVDIWIVDIISHFPVQYALISLIFLLICLRKKYVHLALLAGMLFLFNASVLVDSVSSVQAEKQKDKTLKVYAGNINGSNNDYATLHDNLKKEDAEIVLLLEITAEHVENLHSIIQTFPYHFEQTDIGIDRVGMLFLSKFPVHNYHIVQLSEHGNILFKAILEIAHEKVVFYGVHFIRPDRHREFQDRQNQFLRLAIQIDNTSLPVIIAGDFNATPFSPIFRKFLKDSGLKDSRDGFGWQPTWPAYFPPFWIPIDHILVSPEIQVHKRTTGSYIGSDHLPVIAEISIS